MKEETFQASKMTQQQVKTLPPGLTKSPEPTGQTDRTDYHKPSSDLHTHTHSK